MAHATRPPLSTCATGAVLLFCKAHEQLGDAAYLAAAQRSGEAVWERGLLKKVGGLGYGHGNLHACKRGARCTPVVVL